MPWEKIAKYLLENADWSIMDIEDEELRVIITEYYLLTKELKGMEENPKRWEGLEEHPKLHLETLKKILGVK